MIKPEETRLVQKPPSVTTLIKKPYFNYHENKN